MATTAAPYGLKPVGLLGGRPFAGSTRLLPITASYGTAIGFGDVVKLSGGYVVKDTGTTTATPLGIFMGCTFIDANTGQLTFKQNWVASNAGTNPQAYVCDDPDTVFMIQGSAAVPQTKLGQNAALVQGAVNGSGNSTVSLNAATIATTATLPLRIVDFVAGPTSAVNDAYTDVLVTWNAGMHLYRNATGTA